MCRWRDVIDENKRQLEFMTKGLKPNEAIATILARNPKET